MFYDNFTPDQVCGMFTFWHFMVLIIFAIVMTLALYFSRKMTQQQFHKLMVVVAFLITGMETIKIALKIAKHSNLNGWVPLYYCSLFIYAIWFSLSKRDFVRRMGYSYLVCGGIVAAGCYMLFPTTSLLIYPVWHPSSIYGFVFHWFMMYIGIMVAVKGLYQPKAKDFVNYLVFTTAATILAVIINKATGSNLMILNYPFGLDFLMWVYNISPVLYILVVYVAQSILMYWGVFGIIKLICHIHTKRQAKIELKYEEDEPNLHEI